MPISNLHIATRLIILLLVFQVINLSFSSASFYISYQKEANVDDPDYIDSMIEFVVENILGFPKNTFHDKSNGNSMAKILQNSMHFDWDTHWNEIKIADLGIIDLIKQHVVPRNESFILEYYKTVIPKPPQFFTI